MTLPSGRFDHAAHVRVAWWYLRHCTLGEALDRFARGLKRFAAANGAEDKYHETLTVAWMLLIAERLYDASGLSWPEFASRYPELLARPPLVCRYYTEQTLRSERARAGFVMPDIAEAAPVSPRSRARTTSAPSAGRPWRAHESDSGENRGSRRRRPHSTS
jgi:hypothetical protein